MANGDLISRWSHLGWSPPAHRPPPRLMQYCPDIRCQSIVLGNTADELRGALTRHLNACHTERS
jgi:hypothetical protein